MISIGFDVKVYLIPHLKALPNNVEVKLRRVIVVVISLLNVFEAPRFWRQMTIDYKYTTNKDNSKAGVMLKLLM